MAYNVYFVSTAWDTDYTTTISNFVDSLVATVPGLSRGEDLSADDFAIDVAESSDIYIHAYRAQTGTTRYLQLYVGKSYGRTIGSDGSYLSSIINANMQSATFSIVKTASMYAIGLGGSWLVFGTMTPMRGGDALPVYSYGSGFMVPMGADNTPVSANIRTQTISDSEAGALPPSNYFVSEGIVTPGVSPYLSSPYLINGNGIYKVTGASEIPAGVIMHNATDYFFVYYKGMAYRV